MLMAFSLRKGKEAKASNGAVLTSPVPQAEGHQQILIHALEGPTPHSGHTALIARPVRS